MGRLVEYPEDCCHTKMGWYHFCITFVFWLGKRWNRLDPLGASLAEGLKNVFADKATGTLHARAGALLRLVAWCHKSGLFPFPLREETVYQFMQSSTGTAPTFLRSLLVSLRFAHFVLGLTGADDVVTSHRVIGCAKLAYLQKRRLVQKEPLTVAMVAAMEAYVCDRGQPARERFVIGCFLICTFMRARFSDMMNLVDFTADSIELGDLLVALSKPGSHARSLLIHWRGKHSTTLWHHWIGLVQWMAACKVGRSSSPWSWCASIPCIDKSRLVPCTCYCWCSSRLVTKNFTDHGLSWCKGAAYRHTFMQNNNVVVDVEDWRNFRDTVSIGVSYYPKLCFDL